MDTFQYVATHNHSYSDFFTAIAAEPATDYPIPLLAGLFWLDCAPDLPHVVGDDSHHS